MFVIAGWIKSTNLGMLISWSTHGGRERERDGEGEVFVIVRQNIVLINFGS
jgi:hypothetical protein